MQTPEALIKNKIRTFLLHEGHYVFSPVQMGMGARTLDLLCCIRGRFIAIEVKAPGNKPTALQEATMRRITRAGGMAIWCNSYERFMEWYQTVYPKRDEVA